MGDIGNEGLDAEVIIIGAGPVGLTLALDLGRRGVRTLLVEKNEAPLRLPKMERSNPRTMEIWRRLGVIDEIRAAGLPSHMPMDVLVVRNLVQDPLVRQVYPSVDEMRARIAANNDGTLPREPYQLVSQYVVEPILMERVRQTPAVTVRQGTEFLGLSQDADGVTAEVQDRDGNVETLRARYLVGCDGGGSVVRKLLDIRLAGAAGLGTIFNIFFRCDDFIAKSKPGFARHYCFAGQSDGGGAAGTIVVQGDMKHLAMHIMTEPPEDPAALLRDVTGLDVEPEILFCQPWTQHMMVAERHMQGRVFLAGDANHLYIPAGGLGMNTGIADTANLGWKLAAALQGWAGPRLLDSYETERNAAALRNRSAAQWAVEGVIDWRGAFDPKCDEDSAEGRAALAAFKAKADALNRRVYEMHGADLGYRYESAVIDDAEGPPPASPIDRFEPSSHPGAHLPHVWLDDGRSLYDALPTDRFTLLDLAETPTDTSALAAEFDAIGAPFAVMRIDDARIRTIYQRDTLLVRPDFHVAWRGDALPVDAAALVARVTGQDKTQQERQAA